MRNLSPADALSLFDFEMLADGTATLVPWSAQAGAFAVSAGSPLLPLADRVLANGWKERARDNIAAIRLSRQIVAERRQATPAEREALNRFVGFGASDLANGLFRGKGKAFRAGWEDLGAELESLLSATELASLARSTQYSHYTPEAVVRALWRGARRLGFTGGRILEPGCGTGLVLACAPSDLLESSHLTGYEVEPTAAAIAGAIHAGQDVIEQDFTKATPAPGFDLAIGNPPFSSRSVSNGRGVAGRMGLRLHDYFIARSVELLREDGVAAFVTSHGTMDKAGGAGRAQIASFADLVGAVRLPRGSMDATAGTEVVIDILFLRRRAAGAPQGGADWADLVEVPCGDGAPVMVNRYFAEHPEMVLGAHAWTTSQFGPVYTCNGDTDGLAERLSAAVDLLPEVLREAAPASASAGRVEAVEAPTESLAGSTTPTRRMKEGSYVVRDGGLFQVSHGILTRVQVKAGRGTVGIFAKHERVIRRFVAVRDALWDVLEAQRDDVSGAEGQAALGLAYDAFVTEFGPINTLRVIHYVDADGNERETQRHPNIQPFLDDPDCWLVASIEVYDPETGGATRGAVFTQRVIRPRELRNVVTVDDALAVSLEDAGKVDIARIAALLGMEREAAIGALGERVYHVPGLDEDGWQTKDEYLSGKVRTKLAVAVSAAEADARYERNVAALTLAQPKDLNPSDITARLGAPWLPPEDIARFVQETMGIRATIRHTVELAAWEVDPSSFAYRAQATSEWGTLRRHAGLLLHDALNSRMPQIFDTWEDERGKHRELNETETEAAKEKLLKIKRAFEGWIWKDEERTDRLARVYNDQFNNLVPREFDGSHLTLPGASAAYDFYQHQKRAVWRIISSGGTYVAHAVGAGKTLTLAAAIMEQKRLGFISKAMLIVPGNCLAQTSREFLQLYPTARILVADETNFVKERRQQFIAKATLGDWDCIVLTHAAFKFIPTPADFEARLIQEQLDALEILAEGTGREDRTARKRIELAKERLEQNLESLRGRKDDMVTIADMGVDQIIVDEAQNFRKLFFTTNSGGIKGVDPAGSQRAWDLYVKGRYIAEERRPGRALVLSSGTPITNTLGEMFSVQRFLGEDALRERGIQDFDAWASCFGDTVTELELQPSGKYKPVTRFAEFVNVPELVAMFRSFADVLQRGDLGGLLRLPKVRGGGRQIVTTEPSDAFKAYQHSLAERIDKIEERSGPPVKGDDILLTVIGDGRHAAIDLRLVDREQADEPGNKLNTMIDNIHRIWAETAGYDYGSGRPGATQLVFSDLGTLNAAATRGFSAYAWIKERLVAMGVPASEIAIVQNYKRAAEKQALFNEFNAGRVRVLIGSSETLGTGANVQKRLKALHHLDVPWLPSQIEQREGRIERQGNPHDEVEIYAYATLGSMDAPMWQCNERKSRFVAMAMSGDRGIRRLEDVGAEANQFALAKAIASGDPRLMQKAGLEADIARLTRLRAAHFDDQHAVRTAVMTAERSAEYARFRVANLKEDLARRVSTRGEAFRMEIEGRMYEVRKEAGAALLGALGRAHGLERHDRVKVGSIGGFDITVHGFWNYVTNKRMPEVSLEFTQNSVDVEGSHDEWSALGMVSRLESRLDKLDGDLCRYRQVAVTEEARAAEYRTRMGGEFGMQADLDAKLAELAEIEADLIKTGDIEPEATEADGDSDEAEDQEDVAA